MGRSRFSGAVRATVVVAATAVLAACASAGPRYEARAPEPSRKTATQKVGKPYQINGRWYVPKADPRYNEVGVASWYGKDHQGKPTATGEPFDRFDITAAHKTLPLPSVVEVTNLANGKTLRVRVNDRGPFIDGRIIDLSQEAAKRLGFEKQGTAKVRVRYVNDGRIESAMVQIWID